MINTNKIVIIVAFILMMATLPISIIKTAGDYNAYNQAWSVLLKGGNIWNYNPQDENAICTPYGPFFAAISVLRIPEPLVRKIISPIHLAKTLFFFCWQAIIFFFLWRAKNNLITQIVILLVMYSPLFFTSVLFAGHLDMLLALLLILAFECWHRNKKIVAGLLIALMVATKLNFLPLAIFLSLSISAKHSLSHSWLGWRKKIQIEKKFFFTFIAATAFIVLTTTLFYGNYLQNIRAFLSHYPIRPPSIYFLGNDVITVPLANKLSFILLATSHVLLFIFYVLGRFNKQIAIFISMLLVLTFHKVLSPQYFIVPTSLFMYFMLQNNKAFFQSLPSLTWQQALSSTLKLLPFVGIGFASNYLAGMGYMLHHDFVNKNVLALSNLLFGDSNFILSLFPLHPLGSKMALIFLICHLLAIACLIYVKSFEQFFSFKKNHNKLRTP